MRLLTRSDFDGLGCAVLLKQAGIIDEITFVHPKDVQDGKVEVGPNDVLTNIPYVPGCGLWFDHHSSEAERQAYGVFAGMSDPPRPVRPAWCSTTTMTARSSRTSATTTPFVQSTRPTRRLHGRGDPESSGWVLLSFIMDPRTGLGRYHDYRISNYQLMMDMIDYCRTMSIDEILSVEDVKQRVNRYFAQDRLFREMLLSNTTIRGNVIVIDLRNQEEIYTGNRFVLYSLYPEQNISIQVMWGLRRQNIVMTCGHSIINRSSQTDVGSLMLKYGGGGHRAVGTCQVPIDQADQILEQIILQMNRDG